MSKTPEQLINILRAGGGLILDAATRLPDQLTQMAAAAAGSGATLVLRNADYRAPDDLINIAAAGRGRVIFEL
jgi:hypothetical protein